MLVSCSDNSELNRRIDNLETDVEELNDSISKLHNNYNPQYLQEYLNVDTTNGILGRLVYGDTLNLTGYTSECGEFGGNIEYLKIFEMDDIFWCRHIIDSADCHTHEHSKERYSRIESKEYELSEDDMNEVLRYIFELTKLTFLDKQMYLHVSHWYTAEIVHDDEFGSRIYDFNLYSHDPSCRWTKFIELRDAIKN
jgi:hypothetical protein